MSDKLEARVTPEQDPAERRKWPRKRSLLQATLVTADGSFDCRVLDFSPGGAKVEFAHPLAKKQNVTLILRPIGTFAGVVAWCGSGCFGMQFLGQTSRAGAAPADIAAAVSALKAPAKLAAYLLAKQGSNSSAEPDAPPSTNAAPVPDDETTIDDARSIVVLKADLVADLRRFVAELRTLMGYEDADDGGALPPTR